MVVMILDAVPPSLRGELSRWLTPIGSTVFVGNVSAIVRDRLWSHCIERAKSGRIALVTSDRSERGFEVKLHGYESVSLVDFEGLPFIATRDAAWAEAYRHLEARGALGS